MAKITVQLSGFKSLEDRIRSIGQATPQTVATALTEEAHVVIADSVTNYVPKDTGTLANSARVDPPAFEGGGISVTFGYGGPSAPYAIAVHENPRSGKTMGKSPQGRQYVTWARRGEWKYLETPLKAHAPEVADALRQALNDLIDERQSERLGVATRF